MVDILTQARINAINAVRISFIEWLRGLDADQQHRYVAYREYYDGDHDTQLTKRQRRYLQLKIGEEFNCNLCGIVVDALAERLTVTGFQAPDEETDLLADWWRVNRMDGLQGIVHLSAIRDCDSYLIVDWDKEAKMPRMTAEAAYDGTEGVHVTYSEERRGLPEKAFKYWRIERGEGAGAKRRLNVYYPDRVEKYVSNETAFDGDFSPYVGEDGEWMYWWTSDGTQGGEPLGLPVIHFRNGDQGYNYGQSELKNVIPLQNAQNKAIIDLVAAADTTGFRIYWMLGDDPSGLELGPGSWIYSTRSATGEGSASVGYFPGENLNYLIALKDAFAMDVARVTRTPISYFQLTKQRPSAETLRMEEIGLVARAKNRQIGFGNAWENATMLARRLHNAFGGGTLDEKAVLETQWEDPETRNEKLHLEALKIKSDLGVPAEQLWAEMGYDAIEIAKMRAQRGEELQQQSNIGGALLEAFERGQEGGEE